MVRLYFLTTGIACDSERIAKRMSNGRLADEARS